MSIKFLLMLAARETVLSSNPRESMSAEGGNSIANEGQRPGPRHPRGSVQGSESTLTSMLVLPSLDVRVTTASPGLPPTKMKTARGSSVAYR